MERGKLLKDTIYKQISEKRKELSRLVTLNGIEDHQVLKCSQELDTLIYQIQVQKKKNKRQYVTINMDARLNFKKSITEKNDRYNIEILNRLDLFFQLFNNKKELVFLTKVDSETSFSYILANQPAKALYGISGRAFGEPMETILLEEKYLKMVEKYNKAIKFKEPITYFEIPSTSEKNTIQLVDYSKSTITPVFNQDNLCTHVLSITSLNPSQPE